MNVSAAMQLGTYVLEKGGLKAAGDVPALLGIYRSIASGQKFSTVLTDANLAVIGRAAAILAEGLQDPQEKLTIKALVASL